MKNDKTPPKRGSTLVRVLKSEMKPKPMKRVMLPEVKVTAPRIRKVTEETVRLYPKGMASKRSVDSLKRVGFGKAIGEPMMRRGEKAMYGAAASDVIKKKLNKK
jgi:hypothetical protein